MREPFMFEQYRGIRRVGDKLYAMLVTTVHGGPDVPNTRPLFYTQDALKVRIPFLLGMESTAQRGEEISQCKSALAALTDAINEVETGHKKLESYPGCAGCGGAMS